jgi:hypothetical protein
MTKEEKTEIAAETAGIILGRILRLIVILVGMAGLIFVGHMSALDKPAEPAKVNSIVKGNWPMATPFEYPQGFYASYHSQKPICGVLAVALAAGVTYDVASEACKQAMKDLYPSRQRFGGKTSTPLRELPMKRLGVKFDRTNITSKRPKLIDAVKDFEPDALYLVVVPKHVMTVRNGYVIDQSKLTLVELCGKRANQRVSEITKITGKGW